MTEPANNQPRNKYEEEAHAREALAYNSSIYQPLNALKNKDILEMSLVERIPIEEALRELTLQSRIDFSSRLESAIEQFKYAKLTYTLQNDEEAAERSVNHIDSLMHQAKGEVNERLLGITATDLIRQKSAVRIFNWADPYKATYYSGLRSMTLLAERGTQLYLGDVHRLLNGPEAAWLEKPLFDPSVADQKEKHDKLKEIEEKVLRIENGETEGEKYARFVADTYFWQGVIGEMVTYNPTIKGEELHLSKEAQQLVGDLLRRIPRILENGEQEQNYPMTQQVSVFLNANGDQVPQDSNGMSTQAGTTEKQFFVEVLDYYNKSRSDEEIRWVVSVVSSMAVHNAKHVLENEPSRYNELFRTILFSASEMMKNYDFLPKRMIDFKLARSAFYISDAIAFGSLAVSDRGWNNEWKKVEVSPGKFVWTAEPSQGDPTASGDAFSAHKPHFHEGVYNAIKGRASSFGDGNLLPIDPSEAESVVNAFVSEAEEINARGRTLELISRGKHQQHLATYFGMLRAFKDELGHLPAWKEGNAKREGLGKKINPNLTKAIEESIIFTPTPFGNDIDKHLIFPLLAPQYKISLFDMLSASKDQTVGDLLRKTWIKDAQGKLTEASPENGGKRLTLKDINWLTYGRYADDSRAVNNNFMSQIIAPLYGPLDQKSIDAVANNPLTVLRTVIKAGDIGLRSVIKKFTKPSVEPGFESGAVAKRPSLEIMHAVTLVFHQLALGAHGLIGRDSLERYQKFMNEITPVEGQKHKLSKNGYTMLRDIEDLLPEKQGYAHYADSIYTLFLADMDVLQPITEASNNMANETTKRFEKQDPTGVKKNIKNLRKAEANNRS